MPKPAILYRELPELIRRVWQHKNKLLPGFTSRYNLNRLVYYERFFYPESAIARVINSMITRNKSTVNELNLFDDLAKTGRMCTNHLVWIKGDPSTRWRKRGFSG